MDRREVECQDCGYRWESSAANPRCAKSECGRSRNVEPVRSTDEQTDVNQDEQDDEPDDLDDEPDDLDDEQDDDGSTFEASFKSRQTYTGTQAEQEDRHDDDDEQDDREDTSDQKADSDDDSDSTEDIPELDPETLAMGFEVTFEMIATRRGDHWKLDEDENEAERLGKAWTPVANEYLPYLLKEHTEVGVALMATAAIATPRLMEDKRRAEAEAEREQDDATTDPGTVREPTVGSTSTTDASTNGQADTAVTASRGGYDNV